MILKNDEPEYGGRRYAELDENLANIVVQGTLVQKPGGDVLVSAVGRVGGTLLDVDLGRRIAQLVEQPLRRGQVLKAGKLKFGTH
jgi:hypothetical protein